MDPDMNQNPHGPQPTKATFHPDNTTPIPEETVTQELNLPVPGELMDLPKPSHVEPPPSCYPQLEKLPPLKSWLSKRHYSPSTGNTPREEKEAVGELLSILVDTMHDLNTRSKELLLTKFFSEIERDERLEKVIVERLMESKVQAISELIQQLPSSVREQMSGSGEENSGLAEPSASNDGGPPPSYDADTSYVGSMDVFGTSSTSHRSLVETMEDLTQELERFKVKTLAVGGIGQDVPGGGKEMI